METRSISRRNFIRCSAAAAVAGMAGTGIAHASEQEASDAQQFDEEYDVVIIGAGGAGMNAAVAAYEQGAKVLLCEKAPEGEETPNTKFSGQLILSTDDAEQFYTYIKQIMGFYGNYDEESLKAYCDGAAQNFDWMVNTLGGDPSLIYPETPDHMSHMKSLEYVEHDSHWGIDRKGYTVKWDEYPEFEGHLSSIVLTFSGTDFDASYFFAMMDNIQKREGDMLTFWHGARGRHLILGQDGSVVGAVIEKDGKETRIGAKGGVILTCGGYENNWTMVSNYCQIPYMYPSGNELNTGDGVYMALEAGADLWHMSNISGLGYAHRNGTVSGSILSTTPSVDSAIYVGPSGARFMNEKSQSRHGRISFGGGWLQTPEPIPMYMITDSAHIETPMLGGFSDGNVDEMKSGDVISGDTIDDLSQVIRDAGKAPNFNVNGELQDALDRYNAHCHANDDKGEIDDFGRTCGAAIEVGPFYACELNPRMLNTQGGPRHNGKCEVLNTSAMPIPGLFSAGELGSIFPDMYNGGGNLGETMVFGRIAGTNAALRAQGTFEATTEAAKYASVGPEGQIGE